MRKFGPLCATTVALIVAIALVHHPSQLGMAAQNPAHAAIPAQGSGQNTAAPSRIPPVGCESDGQSGPVPAPLGPSKVVDIDPKVAQRLAYYESANQFGESANQFGILAPLGWHCFGTYGSNGLSLFVSPEPIDSSNLFSTKSNGFAGPLVQLSLSDGGTSGRFAVAKAIARVFPAHREFATKVAEEGIEPATSFPFGAYPKDQLIYKGDEVVEYQTPAQTDGLGTDSLLLKGDDPISGVAILLTGPDSDLDLLQLSVRLPPAQAGLTESIVRQLESDTGSQSRGAPNPASTPQDATSISSSTRSETPKGSPPAQETLPQGSPTDTSEDERAAVHLVLFLVSLVVLASAIVAARIVLPIRQRQALLARADAVIDKHADQLARRRFQLVRNDYYGKAQFAKWDKEIDYFITHHIRPSLTTGECSVLEREYAAIVFTIKEHIERAIREKPSFSPVSDAMTSAEFELFCAEKLRQAGWDAYATRRGRDQGVDVIAEKAGVRIVLQCKLYSGPVGNKAVQEVVAGRAHEQANHGAVVTNSTYTPAAEQLASTNGVLLLHYADLSKLEDLLR
jgi:HJR/Mrr/RecB family endonuclease